MQELIMNEQYPPTEMNPSGKFPSATFCVFSNRFLAIIVSAIVVRVRYGTLVTAAPLIAYAPCALSNTCSSWAQYQALSYVTFSLQTIFKSTKVIPVMLMGTFLKGTKYSFNECLEAILITIGVTTFSLSKSSVADEQISFNEEIIGFGLLCMYVLSDSFTSQWQSKLYKDYGKIESFQMMFGVNVSSIIFTIFALVISGDIPLVIDFFKHYPKALLYNVITAITSTTGQMAIYYTIKKFGPIVFTVIMTTRQMLSIVISNYYFGHPMTEQSYVGCAIVFGAIAYSINNKRMEVHRSWCES
jgi:adenosine 3'-phospho 5'-phosphosulfate transporter B2